MLHFVSFSFLLNGIIQLIMPVAEYVFHLWKPVGLFVPFSLILLACVTLLWKAFERWNVLLRISVYFQ